MISNERIGYDGETKQLALDRIRAYRQAVVFSNDMEDGMRFRDDAYVLATLETLATQKEFLKFPMTCVDEALEEAAKSDHWYNQEKVYDQDHDIDNYEEEDCYGN